MIKKKISVIIPVRNEEGNIDELYRRLSKVISGLRKDFIFEVIITDNASNDKTREKLLYIAKEDSEWKYIRLSRNFGIHNSLACGYDHSSGDALIVLQGDLQDPPEMIPKMIYLWNLGNDVVYGTLKKRNDDFFWKSVGAKIFYYIISLMSESEMPANATDFRLVTRKVIDTINNMKESDRYLRGMVHWVGFNRASFNYDREKRKNGLSSAGLFYCIGYATNAIIAFSRLPLRIITFTGISILMVSLFFLVYIILNYFFSPSSRNSLPTGTTTIILLLSLSIGMNALFIGILGEYIGRIYQQVKFRPLYVVMEKHNI